MALLRREQILVSSVKEKGKEIALPKFGGGVPAKDLAIFVRQFSVMIDAGLPLVQCLEILGSQQENKTFAKILQQTRMDVEGGATPGRRHAQAPQGLRRPLRQHDRGRGGGRYPRHHPEAPGHLHREGGQAEGPGQGRDGLPDRRHLASPASSSRSSCGRSSRPSPPCSRAWAPQLPLPTRIVIALSNWFVRLLPFLVVVRDRRRVRSSSATTRPTAGAG